MAHKWIIKVTSLAIQAALLVPSLGRKVLSENAKIRNALNIHSCGNKLIFYSLRCPLGFKVTFWESYSDLFVETFR